MLTGETFRDPVFKGCTRPAMVLGVPIVPLTVTVMSVLLVSFWTNIIVAVLLFPIVLVMRAVVKTDDQMFRLIWLRMSCRLLKYNFNGRFWTASAYSHTEFTRRK